jgi:hypothetical protein
MIGIWLIPRLRFAFFAPPAKVSQILTSGGKMKSLLLAVSLLFSGSVFAALDLPVLICQSNEKIEGWDGGPTNDYVYYRAYIESSTSLLKAQVTGAYLSDDRDLTADADPTNKYDRTRFGSLEDAWHWFKLLLPKDFAALDGKFKGSIQTWAEEVNQPNYIDLTCFIKR